MGRTLYANLPSTSDPSKAASNKVVSFRRLKSIVSSILGYTIEPQSEILICEARLTKMTLGGIDYYRPNSNLSFSLPLHLEKPPGHANRCSKSQLNIIPLALWPYLEIIRLEKPTGSLLMFWPFAWGLTMAAHRTHLSFDKYLMHLVNFAVYSILLRGAACTVNDILDAKYDAAVERTQGRPLPSGRISMHSAIIFLLCQYIVSITFLTFAIPTLGQSVALSQLLPVFAIYPLLKRITYWPQAWLGIAMNLGFPVAWTTVTGTFDFWILIPALVGCWCWTMLYDTIYACQDIRDDVKAGVRSTAILFGDWIRPLLALCGVLFLKMLIVVGYLNGHGPIYYVITVGGTAVHLVVQSKTVDLEDPKSCWRNFNHNGRLGFIIWAGLLVEYQSYYIGHFALFLYKKAATAP